MQDPLSCGLRTTWPLDARTFRAARNRPFSPPEELLRSPALPLCARLAVVPSRVPPQRTGLEQGELDQEQASRRLLDAIGSARCTRAHAQTHACTHTRIHTHCARTGAASRHALACAHALHESPRCASVLC
eukprot:6185181-Pleurochrysis_carterae.AAC.1